jgi:hypothetical protein
VFDDQRLAARAAAGALRHGAALEARLLPDAHIALPGSEPDPAATWQILGCTPHEGCVVRAEVAGACWVTRIEQAWLARQDREVHVTLERQGDPPGEPLMGWILFC